MFGLLLLLTRPLRKTPTYAFTQKLPLSLSLSRTQKIIIKNPSNLWLLSLTRSNKIVLYMDESKNEGVSASRVVESGTVTASEHVASGDSEKTTKSAIPVGQGNGQIEGSSSEGSVAKEIGSCNGADVMFEDSLSKDVDGVCTRDLGDGGGGNASKETAAVGCEEKDFRSPYGGDGGGGDLDTLGTRDSDVEVSNSGVLREVGGSSKVQESKEEGKVVEGEKKDPEVSEVSGNVDRTSREGQGLRIESEVGPSSKVAEYKGEGKPLEGEDKDMKVGGSSDKTSAEVEVVDADADADTQTAEVASGAGGETQVVVEEVAVTSAEDSLREALLEKGVEVEASQVVDSQEVGLSENDTRDQTVEEAQIAGAEVTETSAEDSLRKALTEKGIEGVDVDASQNVDSQEVGPSENDIRNQTVKETQFVVEEVAVTSAEDSLREALTEKCVEVDASHTVDSQEVGPFENDTWDQKVKGTQIVLEEVTFTSAEDSLRDALMEKGVDGVEVDESQTVGYQEVVPSENETRDQTVKETQIVAEEVAVTSAEDSLREALTEKGVEGVEVDASQTVDSQEVGLFENDTRDQTVNETQIVAEEVAVTSAEDSLKEALTEKGVEVDASQTVDSQEVGLSENDTRDQTVKETQMLVEEVAVTSEEDSLREALTEKGDEVDASQTVDSQEVGLSESDARDQTVEETQMLVEEVTVTSAEDSLREALTEKGVEGVEVDECQTVDSQTVALSENDTRDQTVEETQMLVEEVTVTSAEDSLREALTEKGVEGVEVDECQTVDSQEAVLSENDTLDQTIEETQLLVEDVIVTSAEDSLREALMEKGVVGVEVDASQTMDCQEVGLSENDTRDQSIEETQIVVNEVTVSSAEDSLREALTVKGIERVEVDASQTVDSQEVGLSENDVQDQTVEDGVRGPSMVASSSVAETQVVEISKLDKETGGKPNKKDGGARDALQDSDTQQAAASHDEVSTSGTESAAVTSTIVDGASVETKVEEVIVMARDEILIPKVEASGGDALGGGLAGNSEGIISPSERSLLLTVKDGTSDTNPKMDKETQIAVEGRIASADNEDITCTDTEGMDTDAFSGSFCFSVEELQGTSETANGSTENGYNACADSHSSYQRAQVVTGAEVLTKESSVLLDLEKDEEVIAECLQQQMPSGSAQVLSNIEPRTGLDKLIHDAKAADLQKEQEKTASPQQKAETVNTESKTKTTCGRMEMGIQVALTNHDEVSTSHHETPEPSGKGQLLKPEEGLGQSASCDPAQVDSNKEQQVEAQEQVTPAEQREGKNRKIEQQNSEEETTCVSKEIETQIMDGRENGVSTNKEGLNSETELKGLAEDDQQSKVEDGLDRGASHCLSEIHSNVREKMRIEEPVLDAEHVDLRQGQEMEIEELDAETELADTIEEKSAKLMALKPGNSVKEHQACYQLHTDNEGEFFVSDLVWGKVRSHPWWPGQIFHPSAASEKAMKYHKKDCFLVAYFGDRTFAWNEASLLKPFKSHFSQVEKQSNSETFQNAVDCALEEVSRRVELGLACSCTPKDVYDEIKLQVVENAGIRPEASTRYGVVKDANANLFQPGKLVDYLKALAQSPVGGASRLELVIVKSQLIAFYRLKGYPHLPEYQPCGGLLENSDALQFQDEATQHPSAAYGDCGQVSSGEEILQRQRSSHHKRKHNLKDSIYHSKKERSLSDLMGESWDSVEDESWSDGKANSKVVSPSSGKRRKGSDAFADDASMTEGRETISLAKVSSTAPFPKPSFKIGECIQRVASQMTGSPSILKCNSQKVDGNSAGLAEDRLDASLLHPEDAEINRVNVPTEYSSLDELISQLHSAAQDPLKGYSFLNMIVSFFSDFRNSVVMDQHDKVGGKRKTPHSSGFFAETFEFDDMSDTYWTDRVIQNGSEEQPSRKSRKQDNIFVPVVLDKSGGRSNSRKRYSDSSYDVPAQKPVGYVDGNAPAELVMHFPVVDSVPSEMSLNKMFRRFGPLKESETEVDRDTNRARVIFKRCSDAEAAYGSASKFNIFGPVLVNYQLNYTISVPFKAPPRIQDEEDATLFLDY